MHFLFVNMDFFLYLCTPFMGCCILCLDKHCKIIEYYYIIMRNEYYLFSAFNRLFYRAVHIFVICILMFAGALPVSAQIYSTAQGTRYEASFPTEYGATQQNAYSAHEAQANYNSYQSTVYQPFESSVPSDNNPVYDNEQGEGNGGRRNVTNRQNSFPDRPDTPPAQGSPVGEAWIMLLFAAAAALVVFVRQRKAAKLLIGERR